MNTIEDSFRNAFKKRWSPFVERLLFSIPLLLFLFGITGCYQTPIQPLVLSFVLIVLVVFVWILLNRSPRFLEKRIQKAFYKADQYGEFSATIDSELQSEDTKAKTFLIARIFIWVTATWFVLITPESSLICKRCDIVEIETIEEIQTVLFEDYIHHYLEITLSDGKSISFPYAELGRTISEWTCFKLKSTRRYGHVH